MLTSITFDPGALKFYFPKTPVGASDYAYSVAAPVRTTAKEQRAYGGQTPHNSAAYYLPRTAAVLHLPIRRAPFRLLKVPLARRGLSRSNPAQPPHVY
jgi:hypothetical protein